MKRGNNFKRREIKKIIKKSTNYSTISDDNFDGKQK